MTSPLTPEQQAARDAAFSAFAEAWAQARVTRAEIYARGESEAVAEWAQVPGGPPAAELAATHDRWIAEDRAKRGTEAA